MLFLEFLDTCSNKAVCQVIAGAWVLAYCHKLLPLSVAVASLLKEFASRSLFWCLARLDDASAEFDGVDVECVSVLAHEDEMVVIGDSDDVDPVGVLEHIELVVDFAIRQLHGVAPSGEPGSADEIFTLKGFPAHDIRD